MRKSIREANSAALALIGFFVLCSATCDSAGTPNSGNGGTNGPQGLVDSQSFAFQLQGIDIGEIGASAYDLVIIDYSSDGTDSGAFSHDEITALKNTGKKVLAYLSIGEAEDYRWYWQSAWNGSPPAWLGIENPDWEGNYKIRYWDPAWQELILQSLDRIVDQGFDGVYLDIVDAYYYWAAEAEANGESGPYPTLQKSADDMVDWIATIARHARQDLGKPGFVICPQNATDIVHDASSSRVELFWQTIDAVGSEDTFFFGDDDMDNPWNPQNAVIVNLDLFVTRGKRVLCIDYLSAADTSALERFRQEAAARKFLSYAADRALDGLR